MIKEIIIGFMLITVFFVIFLNARISNNILKIWSTDQDINEEAKSRLELRK